MLHPPLTSAALSVLALHSGFLRRCISWTGLAVSALYLLNQGDVLATAVPGFPVWDTASFLGSTAWGLWIAALGVTLLLPTRAAASVLGQTRASARSSVPQPS
jgi:hypothetical protein